MRRFSGPYWSDRLGLFGSTGSINDVLKDRDEAQMELKACKIKISYLKSGVKFPFYLRLVTGGRKKIAPNVAIADGRGGKDAVKGDSQVKSGVGSTP